MRSHQGYPYYFSWPIDRMFFFSDERLYSSCEVAVEEGDVRGCRLMQRPLSNSIWPISLPPAPAGKIHYLWIPKTQQDAYSQQPNSKSRTAPASRKAKAAQAGLAPGSPGHSHTHRLNFHRHAPSTGSAFRAHFYQAGRITVLRWNFRQPY